MSCVRLLQRGLMIVKGFLVQAQEEKVVVVQGVQGEEGVRQPEAVPEVNPEACGSCSYMSYMDSGLSEVEKFLRAWRE